MNGPAVNAGGSRRDRPLVLFDLLERIARLKAARDDPVEIEVLVAEFRLLRAEL